MLAFVAPPAAQPLAPSLLRGSAALGAAEQVLPAAEGASSCGTFAFGFTAGLALAAAAVGGTRRHPRAPASARKARDGDDTAVAKNVKVGDTIPDVSLDAGFPPTKFALREFCKGKKVVLVGLPGAFTPT
mmetsp:Transcript_80183/g.259804  ORF Transcript_80183/g.259804 Transcript_80183/m.259804 type:complete len:130 (+) Transcript_80183:88-477(+)